MKSAATKNMSSTQAQQGHFRRLVNTDQRSPIEILKSKTGVMGLKQAVSPYLFHRPFLQPANLVSSKRKQGAITRHRQILLINPGPGARLRNKASKLIQNDEFQF